MCIFKLRKRHILPLIPMSISTSKLKDAAQLVTAIASAAAILWAFVQKVGAFSTHALIVQAGLLMMVTLGYVAVSPKCARVLGTEGSELQLRRFGSRIRRWAWAGTGLIGIGLVVDYALLAREKKDRIVILVANFDGPDETFGMTERLFDELRRLEAEDPRIRVLSADTVISPQMGSRFARALGAEESASLVIWGWYRQTADRVSVTVAYETFDDPCWLRLGRTSSYAGDAKELSCFTVQAHTSAQAASIAGITSAVLYYTRADYPKARQHFTAALRMLEPADTAFITKKDQAKLYHRYAFSAWQTGDHRHAIALYDTALALNPDNADAFAGRGELHFLLGDYARAFANWDSAVGLDPGDAALLQRRGYLRGQRGQFSLAYQDLNQSIRLDPEAGWGYYSRAETAMRAGEFEAAIRDFTIALSLSDTASRGCHRCAFNGRGQARLALYDRRPTSRTLLDEAISDFSAVLRLDPTNTAARFNRGSAYARRGNRRLAIRDYDKVLQIDPRNTAAYVERAWIRYSARGQWNAALLDLDAAIRTDSTFLRAYRFRGEVRARSGQTDLAIQDFRHLRERSADPAVRRYAEDWVKRLSAQH